MTSRKTTEQFILEAKAVHSDTYRYDKTEYVNSKTKVLIFCYECNEYFEQTPDSHLRGSGCKQCGNKLVGSKLRNTCKRFIQNAIEVHGDSYVYDEAAYIVSDKKVKIFCKKCNEYFEQTPDNHLQGSGCIRCANKYTGNILRESTTYFINKAFEIYGNTYSYELVNYLGAKTPVTIICTHCNKAFAVVPSNFYRGTSQCKHCKMPTGERLVKDFLSANQITFQGQKTFDDLLYKKKLKYDFFLPQYKLLIEYNGIQHYEPVKHFGGNTRFETQLCIDALKRNYAYTNGYDLLVIDYNNKDIPKTILEAVEISSYKFSLGEK